MSRSLPRLLPAAAALAVSVSGVARAEPTSEERALASLLFEDGRKLMDEGQLDKACPKLEESQRLDPGGGTLLNTALCHEKQGKVATAWAEFTEARGMARTDDRPERFAFAEEHLAALAPRLAWVIVRVLPESQPATLQILRNGRPLSRTTWNTRVPVDPGKQRIEAQADGWEPWSTEIDDVVEGAEREVTVPPLVERPKPPPPRTPPPIPTPPVPAPERPLPILVPIGIAVGATGLASLSVAAVMTGLAVSKRAASEDLDPTCDPGCSDQAVELNDEALVFADAATGTLIAGLALAGTSAVLLSVGLTEKRATAAPSASAAQVWVGPGRAGVTLRF